MLMIRCALLGALALIGLSLLLAGCDSAGDEPLWQPEPHLVPLAVGNSWTFERSDDIGNLDTFRIEITSTREIEADGKRRTVYEQSFTLGGTSAPYRWYVGNEPDGYYLYGGWSEAGDTTARESFWRYPVRKGDRYAGRAFGYNPERGVYAADVREWTVLAVDTLIDVRGQPMRANVYQFVFQPADDVAALWDIRYFNVPGVGNVKEEIWTIEPPGSTTGIAPRVFSESLLISRQLH
jgi:hypothetical protein